MEFKDSKWGIESAVMAQIEPFLPRNLSIDELVEHLHQNEVIEEIEGSTYERIAEIIGKARDFSEDDIYTLGILGAWKDKYESIRKSSTSTNDFDEIVNIVKEHVSPNIPGHVLRGPSNRRDSSFEYDSEKRLHEMTLNYIISPESLVYETVSAKISDENPLRITYEIIATALADSKLGEKQIKLSNANKSSLIEIARSKDAYFAISNDSEIMGDLKEGLRLGIKQANSIKIQDRDEACKITVDYWEEVNLKKRIEKRISLNSIGLDNLAYAASLIKRSEMISLGSYIQWNKNKTTV